MGRTPCCSKEGLTRGSWTAREDTLLIQYIQSHGEGHWRSLPKKAGLLRCGKSCRLRWLNYLRPDIKRGNITPDEEDLIVRLHSLLGNRWSLIAGRLPGRTDNEIKNYWNTHLRKRLNNNDADKKEESKCVGAERGENDGGCVAKIKVHQPKAIRVSASSSITRNIDYNLAQSGHQNSEVSSDLHNLTCSDKNHEIKNYHSRFGEALVCDNEKEFDDFVQGYGACSEMTYEEYEQLFLKAEQDLQLDSFIDSLQI